MTTGVSQQLKSERLSQRDHNKPEDGSLLRLFQSDMFDAYYHMYYLYHREEVGIQDYLVNLLYKRTDEDIYFYLPQLCCLCLARYKTSTLYRFVLEKASKSMHLALKTAWLFQAASDELWNGSLGISTQLNQEVEMAIVNSKPAPFGLAIYGPESEVEVPDLFLRQRIIHRLLNSDNQQKFKDVREKTNTNDGSDKEDERKKAFKDFVTFVDEDLETSDETVPYVAKVTNENDGTLSSKHAVNHRITIQLRYPSVPPEFSKHTGPIEVSTCRSKLPSVYEKLGSPFIYSSFRVDDPTLINSDMQRFIIKQRRCDYYNLLNSSISSMIDVSNRLAQVSEENFRILLLQKFFESLNEWIFCRRCIVAASEGTFAMTGLTIPASEFGSLNTTGDASHSTQVLRFITEECKVLSSKKRAPFVLVFEFADLDEDLYEILKKNSVNYSKSSKRSSNMLQLPDYAEDVSVSKVVANEVSWDDLYVYSCLQEEFKERQLLRVPEDQKPPDLLTRIRYSMGIKDEFFENKSYQVSANYSPRSGKTSDNEADSEKEPVWELNVTQPSEKKTVNSFNLNIPATAADNLKSKNVPEESGDTHWIEEAQNVEKILISDILAQAGFETSKQKEESLDSTKKKTEPAKTEIIPNNIKANNVHLKLNERENRLSLQKEPPNTPKSSDEGTYAASISKHHAESTRSSRRERSKSTGECAEPSEASNQGIKSSIHGKKSVWKRAAYAKRLRFKLWGRLWSEKKEKYRKLSPYAQLKSWNLGCVLVKGGDDLRLELLASQLVRQFQWIFENARLPLYVRPYEVLVTGVSSGIMVFVPDTVSVHTLKKRFKNDSIAQVFEAAFADNPYQAKKNFIESHAAYSVIGYLLQVKDRHNANFLLDAEGHIIHIDYGFMLSNSPGYVNFEGSPFKLTQEFIDIMDGEVSDNYEYFRTLVIRGFLAARKYRERLLLLVKMMLPATKMSCFSGDPPGTLAAMEERFMPNLTEEVCIQRVADLIDMSVNNWRTIQYDAYQRYTNKIL